MNALNTHLHRSTTSHWPRLYIISTYHIALPQRLFPTESIFILIVPTVSDLMQDFFYNLIISNPFLINLGLSARVWRWFWLISAASTCGISERWQSTSPNTHTFRIYMWVVQFYFLFLFSILIYLWYFWLYHQQFVYCCFVPEQLIGGVIDWWSNWLVGQLIGGAIDWWSNWLVGNWLVGHLNGGATDWWGNWLVGQLIGGAIDWWSNWLVGQLIGGAIDWWAIDWWSNWLVGNWLVGQMIDGAIICYEGKFPSARIL